LKGKGLLIVTIIFFLVINTAYYWEVMVGFFLIPILLILVIVYLVLVVLLIRQIYIIIRDKFSNKFQLLVVVLLTSVLTLTFFKPYGFIDYDKLQGNDLLIAGREGVANCMTILKLKDNYTFRARSMCFGVTEIKGEYHLQNDTIYFDNVKLGRNEDEYYEFAIIRNPSEYWDFTYECISDLRLFKNQRDTIGDEFCIIKDELYKLKNKTPNR
jgi:hypothetical protein